VQKKQKVVSAAPLEQPLEPSTLAEEKTPELPGVEPAKVEEKDEEQIDISLRSVSQTVRVDIKKLNDLMNVVGELVLVRSAMQVISEKLKKIQGFSGVATEFFKETRNFNRKLEQLQTGIMNVRMVPLGQNFEKLSRMVRRISHSLNKEVDLKTSGADTEVDKLIVEDLADPLMHILRNAIDHGIEDVSVREAHGKPRVGLITMDAYTKGSHVIIKIRDDGQGIDLEKIRTSALKKEVVSPDRISELSDKDLLNLLFLPGFSTSEQVSEISGRGVGLDVVKTNIAAMSGMIDIESKFDVGTCLTITLPITLAIMQALIVQVKNHIYAIPLSSVVEIITLEISDIRTIEQREMCELRGVTVPLVRLERLFDLQGVNAEEDQNIIYAVLVGLAENRVGIVVDELRGQEDIVIKSMGKSLIHASGIAGAANLANQQTILVLDVASLINEALSYV
jgi:two-component system chemotaxis sensor kinase CheA